MSVTAHLIGGPVDGRLQTIEFLTPNLLIPVMVRPLRLVPGTDPDEIVPYLVATYERGFVDVDFEPYGSVWRYWWIGTS